MSNLKILFFLMLFFSLEVRGETLCLDRSEVFEVSQHFKELSPLLEETESICLNLIDRDKKELFLIAHTVITLKNMKIQGRPGKKTSDDLQVKVTPHANWWGYFTERAKEFVINPTRCKYSSGTIAYVFGDRRDGLIYLCPLFFDLDLLEQVETLLHEVRHFDGFPHVECSHGVYQYRGKNCDVSIQQKGSYAVTIQALVLFSQKENISAAQKHLLESLVVGRTLNNFNKKPRVKTTDYAYLSNRRGEVYRTDVKNLSKIELVTKLATPSMLYSNGNHFTMIPIDRTLKAQRMNRRFNLSFDIGLYAKNYNSEEIHERELYSLFDYYGDGLIKDGEFYNSCGVANDKVDLISFEDIKFKSMLKLKVENDKEINLLIGLDGRSYQHECTKGILAKTNIFPTMFEFPDDIVGGFSDHTHHLIYLNDGGEILRYKLKNQKITPTKIPQMDWISITPHRVFKLLDD